MPYARQQQNEPAERPPMPPQYEGLFQEPQYPDGVVFGEDDEDDSKTAF